MEALLGKYFVTREKVLQDAQRRILEIMKRYLREQAGSLQEENLIRENEIRTLGKRINTRKSTREDILDNEQLKIITRARLLLVADVFNFFLKGELSRSFGRKQQLFGSRNHRGV